MGAILEAVSVSRPRPWRREGSVALETRATDAALRDAGWDADDLDLLINTGVYRDGHLCEPAMAPLVQRRIGANLKPPEHPRARSTFSFDLSNGPCGTLIALQTADGLMASGRIERAAVVAGDVDPTPRVSRGLRLAPLGAALLLRRGNGSGGFTAFHTKSFPEHAELRSSHVRWIGDEPGRPFFAGKQALILADDNDYPVACVACAHAATDEFLAAQGLRWSDIDLFLPGPAPAGFPAAFATRAGIEPGRLVDAPDLADTYTAGLPAVLARAVDSGRWASARRALLLAVGPGITVSLALHEQPASSA